MTKMIHRLLVLLLSLPIVFAVQISNDVCTSATALGIGGSVQGTTVDATVAGSSVCLSRENTSHGESPGVWYEIVGTGGGIRAYTCAANGNGTLSRGIMTVYEGNCSSLQCTSVSIMEIDEEKCDASNQVGEVITWFGLKDVTYYLLVRGTSNLDVGTFDLEIKHLPSLADHDVCQNALPVDGMDRVDDEIGGNRSSTDFVYCPFLPATDSPTAFSSGLWYQFQGTGKTIQVAPPCGGYEFLISVHVGECGLQDCVGTPVQQNVCGPDWGKEPVIVVDTVEGQTYHVLVRHISTSIRTTSFYLQFDDVTTSGSGRLLETLMPRVLLGACTLTTALLVMW